MNFEFYIVESKGKQFFQYPDDTHQDVFEKMKINSDNQLTICHQEYIVYYIYTVKQEDRYIGLSIIFNGIIATNYQNIEQILKDIYKDYLDTFSAYYTEDNIISHANYNLLRWRQVIKARLKNNTFIECSRPIKSFRDNDTDFVEYSFDKLNIEDFVNAVKVYNWINITIPKKVTKVNKKETLKEKLWGCLEIIGPMIAMCLWVYYIFRKCSSM